MQVADIYLVPPGGYEILHGQMEHLGDEYFLVTFLEGSHEKKISGAFGVIKRAVKMVGETEDAWYETFWVDESGVFQYNSREAFMLDAIRSLMKPFTQPSWEVRYELKEL